MTRLNPLTPENIAWLKQHVKQIAVLYGGLSAEREISLMSGEAIYEALKTAGFSVTLLDVNQNFLHQLQTTPFDFAFIALHGRGGEDGVIQAILEWQNIPYSGSGVLASALAMDKIRSKTIWQAHNLPVLPQAVLDEAIFEDEAALDAMIAHVGFPMAVKPALEGSSLGIKKVTKKEDLKAAYQTAAAFDTVVMAETWVTGKEYTGAILADTVLPLIRIDISEGFYDFDTKYKTGANAYLCPCGLTEEAEKSLQNLMLNAAKIIGYRDWSRVDAMIDESGKAWLLEINTIPGMTKTSLVPKAAAVAGLDFQATVLHILNSAVMRYA